MAPRPTSKVLVLQLNPKPFSPGRFAHCKGCNEPLLPRGYRLKPNKFHNWHVHCYEDAFGLGDMLINNQASLACDATRIDVEAIAYIFQWETDFLGIDPDIIDGYLAAVSRACMKRTRSEDTDDAEEVNKHKKPRLDFPTMASADDPDAKWADCPPESVFEIRDALEGAPQVYDGTNQRMADFYLNIPINLRTKRIGPATVKMENSDHDESFGIPRFPAKLSELLSAMEKKRERVLRGVAASMYC